MKSKELFSIFFFDHIQEQFRDNKSMKIDFPLNLMVYHRKIITFIKQNAMANWASIKDSIELKGAFKNII